MYNLANHSRLTISKSFVQLGFVILFGLCHVITSAQYSEDHSCEDFQINVFDLDHLDSISKTKIAFPPSYQDLYYSDITTAAECVWNNFKGHFDIDHWTFKADNSDGKLFKDDAPHSIAIKGASHSPINNYQRYVAKLKIPAPTSGYVAFDWNSFGGSFPHIDAFYFTVNDSCVQLSAQNITEGHFVSWYINEGDIISLEQASNGSYNHITTKIFNWKFIPDVYQIIDRKWTAKDDYGQEVSCTQHIEVTRPSLEDFSIPLNQDGYETPALSCKDDRHPDTNHYPYFQGLKSKYHIGSEAIYGFKALFKDELVSRCGGNKTINRRWWIKDICSEATIERNQKIKVIDDSPISIKCPADQTFNISKCQVSVYIRKPRAWSACNDNIDVDISWAYGKGSKVYSNVTPGSYEITFTATDNCGKEKVCKMWLHLLYDAMDALTCKENVEINLPASGNIRIPATDLVDLGSSCSDLTIEVDGGSYLDLDCADIGWNTYTIKYYDPRYPSNFKTCLVKINLIGNAGGVSCKQNLSYNLPAAGSLNIPVGDLVNVDPSACSNYFFEIEGKGQLYLDCSDIGTNVFTVKYYDPNHPSNIQYCDITIEVSGPSGIVTCKENLSFQLPEAGSLNVLAKDLVHVENAACGNYIFEVNGKGSLTLDCNDIGEKTYTVKYYDQANPYDVYSCDVSIVLHGEQGSVTCKNDISYTLPVSGNLTISATELVHIQNGICGNYIIEVNGKSKLELDCSDVGTSNYTIRYYDQAKPYDVYSCNVSITLHGEQGNVTCKDDLSYTLPVSGNLTVPVTELVHIQSGICGNYIIEVNGKSKLELDCSDVGSSNYTIRYYDPTNPNDIKTCTVTIQLTGGNSGSLLCPNNVVLECGTDVSDLSKYGEATAEGVDPSQIYYTESRQINSCGTGQIVRTWRTDAFCGGEQSCSQVITIERTAYPISVEWPEDYSTGQCIAIGDLSPDYLPTANSFPVVIGNTACRDIRFTYLDSQEQNGSACIVIIRTWKATDVCDPSYSDSYVQRLSITDSTDPKLTAPSDQNVTSTGSDCGVGYVSISPATAQDCDDNVVIINDSPYADQSGPDASGSYPAGVTTITYTATDRCGNQSMKSTTISVVASGEPELTCIGEFDVNLTRDVYDNVIFTLSPDQLITSPSASCGGYSYIYAFSAYDGDVTRELNCDDIGLKAIEVFRYNGSSWTSCEAWVRITDPAGHCASDASFASVSGKVSSPSGDPVKYAKISVETMDPVNTDDNGEFVIGNIPTGNSYNILPSKEINIRNGVNSLDMLMLNRHLLGTREITSPYSIIAADMNNSKSVSVGDLYVMNGLILANINDLDRSWKFIPEDFVFPNPTKPFESPFPESIDAVIVGDMSNMDFIAVKSGDVNDSADPKKLLGLTQSNQKIYLSADDQIFEKDQTVDIAFNLDENQQVEAMQFTLHFDHNTLVYKDALSSFGLNKNLVVNENRAAFGELGIVFLNYNQDEKLAPLRLRFQSLQTGSVKAAVTFTSDIYSREAYYRDKIFEVELAMNVQEDMPVELIATPNPFTSTLNLQIKSAETEDGSIEIFDMTGQQIGSHYISLIAGDNTCQLDNKDFENAGIYLIRLRTTDSIQQLKVVLID